MAGPSSAQNLRGIASVAQIYLSRNTNGSPYNSPPRTPPAASFASLACPPAATTDNNPSLPESPSPDISHETTVELLIGIQSDPSLEKSIRYARYLFQQDTDISLVLVDKHQAHLVDFQTDIDNPERTPITKTSDNSELRSALIELAMDCDTLLIHIDPSCRLKSEQLIAHDPRITLLAGCDSSDIIQTYQTLKSLAPEASRDRQISLFLCSAPDPQTAQQVFQKLCDTAQKFLYRKLQLKGYELVDSDTSTSDSISESAGIVSFTPSFQERHSLNHNPLSTENHTPKPPEKNRTEFNQNSFNSSADSPEIKPLTPHCRPPILQPVQVSQLPRTDIELNDTLQLALPGWLKIIPTAIAIPLPLPSHIPSTFRVLLDATGRIFIFTATLSSHENIWPQALAAQKWVTENISLIGNFARQLHIDPSQNSGIIMVTAQSPESLRTLTPQTDNFPCHVLPLHLLQAENSRYLLIVN